MQHMAYSRSLASPSVSEQRDTSHQQGPQQPTSTSSGLQELQGFSLRWEGLSETIKGKSDVQYNNMGSIGTMINGMQCKPSLFSMLVPPHCLIFFIRYHPYIRSSSFISRAAYAAGCCDFTDGGFCPGPSAVSVPSSSIHGLIKHPNLFVCSSSFCLTFQLRIPIDVPPVSSTCERRKSTAWRRKCCKIGRTSLLRRSCSANTSH